jgi:hypothetical protein
MGAQRHFETFSLLHGIENCGFVNLIYKDSGDAAQDTYGSRLSVSSLFIYNVIVELISKSMTHKQSIVELLAADS